MPPPEPRDDLVDQLRAGAAPVDAGRFRIDSNRALEKLRQFRLADPHHYVLELVRAAVASRARWATVRTDADDFELAFDGDPFPPSALKELLAQALLGGDDRDARRARLLSLGVAGALALQPRWVRVQSGEWLVELDGNAAATVSRAPPLEAPRRTFVHVRERLSWRVARDALLGSREARAIEDFCRELPIPLTLNGKALGPGRSFDEPVLARSQQERDGVRLWAAFPRRRLAQSVIRFHLHGVQICERRWDGPRTPILATVHDDRLQRNASGSDVVETDPRYRGALQGLEEMVEPLLVAVAQRLKKEADRESRELLLEASVGATGKVRGIIESAPILPGPAGEWFSVNDLRKEHAAGRPLRYATRPYPADSYTRPTLLLEADRRVLELLPGRPRVDVAEEVAARAAALEHRRRWEAQESEELRLPAGQYLARAVVKGRGFSGEAGVQDRPGQRATVRVLLERRLLFVESPDSLPPGTVAVVNIATPAPMLSDWARPNAGITIQRFLPAIQAALSRGAAEAVAGEPPDLGRGLRALARWLVADALRRSEEEAELEDRLPEALWRAPVFELAEEEVGFTSLEEMRTWPRVRWVEQPWRHPLFSGEPAVTLAPRGEADALERLWGVDRVEDVTALLRAEAAVRRRVAAGPEPMALRGPTVAALRIEDPAAHGKMGLLEEGGSGLELRLFVRGILVEEVSLPAHYGHVAASIASEQLSPRDGWSGVVRDQAFDHVVALARGGERALMESLLQAYGDRSLDRWPLAGRKYFRAFAHRELSGLAWRKDLDAVARTAALAEVIPTSQGLRSLDALSELTNRERQLWIQELPPDDVPEDMLIVYADSVLAAAIKQVARAPDADPTQELKRRRSRAAFRRRASAAPKVDASLQLIAQVDTPDGIRGEVGAPARSLGTQLELSLGGRLLESRFVETVLGMDAALDLPEGSMDPVDPVPPLLDRAVHGALEQGELRLLQLGAEKWDWPETRALVYRGLGANLDARLPHQEREALLDRPLVPAAGGQWLPVRTFDEIRHVGYVRRDPGEVPSRGPVVVVDSNALEALLPRWTATDVTDQVEAELKSRRRRGSLPRLERFTYGGLALERVPLEGAGARGEIALVATRTGTLELFHRGRPLCLVRDEQLPECAAAVVNDDRLTPTADESDVVVDRAYHALVRELVEHLDRAAGALAARWIKAPAAEQATLRTLSIQLAIWQAKRKVARAPLLELPLLEASDGAPMTFAELLARKARRRPVPWSSVAGTLLDASERIWRPRPGERPLVGPLSLPLEDWTAQVRDAEDRRARSRRESFQVGLPSDFREPLPPPRRGEVALPPDEPSGQLQLTIFKDGLFLETSSIPHEIGGVAKVDDPALAPEDEWRKARRDDAFKAMRQALDLAVERAVVKRLASRAPGWLAYARAAIAWRSGSAGPLAEALPGLELFTDAAGKPARLGEVMAEVSRRGAVGLVDPEMAGAAPKDRLVLIQDGLNQRLLADLQLRADDLTADLKAARDVEATRAAKRLRSWTFPGAALVRHAVDRPGGLRGELALPLDPREGRGVTLARDGIAVQDAALGHLAVAGVLEHPALAVDPTWRTAELTPEQQRDLKEEVDALYRKLAGVSPAFEPAQRAAASIHALRYLQEQGMTDASQLDRLPETAQRVADAPVLRSAEGRWVGVRTAAGQAMRRNRLSVLGAQVKGAGVLALEAQDLGAEWVPLLGEVLGWKRVQVIHDLEGWQEAQARAEPEDDGPLARGLDRLRREAALLHGDALGRLTTKELEHLRLHRRGGKGAPIRYSELLREATLDPEHPLIREALERAEDRPEAVYVLLAAAYGAVNRALERVTDEDEARMLGALVRHLAANPELLDPKGSARDQE
ncbi:MAG TPA: hypothetical protein VFA20_01905 [Myxococcaceae bacterium]|nr:hypothetical protein [Myxococcaceae bacterium]